MDRERAACHMAENMKTIFAYALSRVQHKADAEDLAGDIIVAVLENCHTLRCDEAFFGWFWSIANHTVQKYYRRKQKDAVPLTEDIPDGADDLATAVSHGEELALLRRELSLLTREYRICTVAYYFDGRSCRAISETYGISLEMVKYYLYKTRHILKEGLTMTRTFGEKSFHPVPFQCITIFEGSYNAEYRHMLDRLLPGNILHAAYYTPMTVGELSLELGVAAAYVEDEIALLEKYDLLTRMPAPGTGGKVQTKLCIFSRAYDEELHRLAEERLTAKMGTILSAVRDKLPQIRELHAPGMDRDDDLLIWALLFQLLSRGHNRIAVDGEKKELYSGARGINYGEDYEPVDDCYSTGGFAGYYGLGDDMALCFGDFGVLPKKNHFGWDVKRLRTLAVESRTGESVPLLCLRDDMVGQIYGEILVDVVAMVSAIYAELTELAIHLMETHAPRAVQNEIPAVIQGALFHRTVGLMGKLAVDSGTLHLPPEGYAYPVAGYVYLTR